MNLRLNLTVPVGRLRRMKCHDCPGARTFALYLRGAGHWGGDFVPVLVELAASHPRGEPLPAVVDVVEHSCGRPRAEPLAVSRAAGLIVGAEASS
jgi:hypothetical protein